MDKKHYLFVSYIVLDNQGLKIGIGEDVVAIKQFSFEKLHKYYLVLAQDGDPEADSIVFTSLNEISETLYKWLKGE